MEETDPNDICEGCGQVGKNAKYQAITVPEVSTKPIVSQKKLCDDCIERIKSKLNIEK